MIGTFNAVYSHRTTLAVNATIWLAKQVPFYKHAVKKQDRPPLMVKLQYYPGEAIIWPRCIEIGGGKYGDQQNRTGLIR